MRNQDYPIFTILRPVAVGLFLLLLQACTTHKPYYSRDALDWNEKAPKPENKLQHTVFLIGDVGAPDLKQQEPSLKLMQKQMREAGAKSTTVFLGDNVYHNGLPEPGRYDREVSEQRLNAQLDVLRGYQGDKYMIPGNHDWNHSGRGGIKLNLHTAFRLYLPLAVYFCRPCSSTDRIGVS